MTIVTGSKERKLVTSDAPAAAPAAPAPAAPGVAPHSTAPAFDDDGYIIAPAAAAPAPAAAPAAAAPVASYNSSAGLGTEGYVAPAAAPAAPQTAPVATASYNDSAGLNNGGAGGAPPAIAGGNPNPTTDGNPQACAPSLAAAAAGDAWQTKLFQYNDPVTPAECAFGFFCFQCAQAKAKSQMDGSGMLFNCCCWHHGATLSWMRERYGIAGACGEDMMSSLFCGCCAGRRVYTEARLRGAHVPPTPRPAQQQAWKEALFGCSAGGCLQAAFCPCCVAHDVRIHLQERGGMPEPDFCYDVVCLPPCAMYGQVRHVYNLEEQGLPAAIEDVCVPLVLMPCALSLAARESRVRKSA